MMGRDQLKFHKNELGLISEFLMIIVKGVWSRKNDVEFFFSSLLYPANHNYKLMKLHKIKPRENS